MKLLPILIICFTVRIISSCEDGWTRFNRYCYKKFNADYIKAQEANNFCRKYGANLTTVRDENERLFIFEFTTTGMTKDLAHQTLIGGYRTYSGSAWKWYDGTPFTQHDFFRYGEPTSNGLSLMLRSDPFLVGGLQAGYFASVGESVPAHLFVCKKEETRKVSKCEDKWTAFGMNCYRRFSSPHTRNGNANNICNQYGSTLTSVTTEDEKQFVMDFANTGRRSYPEQATVVGGYRESASHPWKWYDGKPFQQHHWFITTGFWKMANRLCLRLRSDVPVDDGYWETTRFHLIDQNCTDPSYVLVCKKPGSLVCDPETMSKIDGKCTCKSNFVDVVDTDLPEAKDFKRGEKCVKGVCHSVRDSTSILFIIDSSESITTKHWPSMVNFVKQGASKLPNSFRVGFLKFSTKVSDKKWVEPKWTKEDYEDSVPVKYESGQTNTPLALKEARKMFKNDDNKNKIAVLITDGLPIADEYDSEGAALNATKKAARELRSDGVRLTVMGVGPDISKGRDKIVDWIKNPKTDYFYFHDTVDCLKGTDMDKLLQVVCRRD